MKNDKLIKLSSFFRSIDFSSKNIASGNHISTGYRSLDKFMDWINSDDVIVIGSRPAMGKTTLVLNIAYNIANSTKLPVAYFSLGDNRAEELSLKLISKLSKVKL